MYNLHHVNMSRFRNEQPKKSIFEPQSKIKNYLEPCASNVHIAKLSSDSKLEKLESECNRLENTSRKICGRMNEIEHSNCKQLQL